MAEWYVFDGVAEHGPFSEDDFLAFLNDKDPAKIKIWRDGLDSWVPAKSIPTLVAMMRPASSPQPAVSPVETRAQPVMPAPADITVAAGDHFAQIADNDDIPASESKWLWAICGAGVGLAWALLNAVIGGISPLNLWGTEIVAAPLALVGIKVLSLTMIGFAAGCIRDAFRKDPVDETAAATGGSAPANENEPLSTDAAKAA